MPVFWVLNQLIKISGLFRHYYISKFFLILYFYSNTEIFFIFYTYIFYVLDFYFCFYVFTFNIQKWLNKNGDHRPIGSASIRMCGHVWSRYGMRRCVSLGVGFEDSDAEAIPSVSHSIPTACRSICKTLSNFSSTVSACISLCFLS